MSRNGSGARSRCVCAGQALSCRYRPGAIIVAAGLGNGAGRRRKVSGAQLRSQSTMATAVRWGSAAKHASIWTTEGSRIDGRRGKGLLRT